MGTQGREQIRLTVDRPVIFVGESPSSRSGPPLGGAIGRRLAELAGVSEEELRRRCEMVNLLDECPPLQPGGKGRTFDAEAAGDAALRLRLWNPGAVLVLLGRRVARAFGLRPPSPVWMAETVLVVPHPSGIVRWWNRAENRRQAAVALRRFLSDHGGSGKREGESERPGRSAGSLEGRRGRPRRAVSSSSGPGPSGPER